jgi:hypothetical protein
LPCLADGDLTASVVEECESNMPAEAERRTAVIASLLQDDNAFGPDDIEAMSTALDDVCTALNLSSEGYAKEIVAMRIVELAQPGKCCRTTLRDRLLQEANGGTGL